MKDVPNFTAGRNKVKKLYEKESKLKGKKAYLKPIEAKPATNFNDISFEDL